jgi:hypothetical protein
LTWKLSVSKLVSPGPLNDPFVSDNDVAGLPPTVTLEGTAGLTLMETPADAVAAPASSAVVATSTTREKRLAATTAYERI